MVKTRFKIIPGYKGSGEIMLAIEKGEVEGVCLSWDTLKTIKHASHGAFSLRIKVSSGRAHHLSVHVKFTAASHTSAKTLHKTLARCAARVIKPRFTG